MSNEKKQENSINFVEHYNYFISQDNSRIIDFEENISLNKESNISIQESAADGDEETISMIIPAYISKKSKFNIETKELKRKRKSKDNKNSKNKIHTWKALDNLKNKLRVHINQFLINLGNDAVNSYLKDKKTYFKEIFSELKRKKINKNELRYKNIFNLRISKKNKGKGSITDESTNKEVLDEVCKYSELNEFFEQKLSDVIELYERDKEKFNNIFEYKSLKIKLSDNTKTFYNLLEEDRYRIIKDKLLNILDQNYI